MSKETVEILAQLATVVTAGFAGWAALAARNAAKASRVTVNAQLVSAAVAEYFQPSMAKALRTLRSWSKIRGSGFANIWVEEFKQNRTEAVEVEEAKRLVKGFFEKATRLHSAKLIDDEMLRAIASVHGIEIYYDIVVPLDVAQNPDVNRDTERLLLFVVGRYPSRPPKV